MSTEAWMWVGFLLLSTPLFVLGVLALADVVIPETLRRFLERLFLGLGR